jgi:ribonuclease HIII
MTNENEASKTELNVIYESLKSSLQFMGIKVSDYQSINYGIQFSVSINSWSGILRVYQNKKGNIKIDYSQLGDDNNAIHIQSLLEDKETSANLGSKNKINSKFDFGYPIIGTDESGKGDYFGPLVSAGVFLDEHTANELIKLGVKDSKNLSDSQNITLAKKIIQICNGNFTIIEISPLRYNQLYTQFKKENKNLNTLLAWGHAKAIEELLAKVDCSTAIADQFADEKFIQGKLQEKGKTINLIQRHKAEQNIAVAAASILARARFLEKLSKLSEQYKLNFPKGASINVIEVGRIYVKLHRKESLINVAKLHFKTTESILDT